MKTCVTILSVFMLIGLNISAIQAQTPKLFFATGDNPVKEQIIKVDSAQNKAVMLTLKYTGSDTITAKVKLNKSGTLASDIFEFMDDFTHVFHDAGTVGIQFVLKKNFKYKDVLGKTVYFQLSSTSDGLVDNAYSMLVLKFEKEQKTMELDDFLRVNVGTNFDYIAANPFKLLYADISIMSPNAFQLKNVLWKDKSSNPVKMGLYGRVYQFQGVSQQFDKNRDPIFFYAPNGGFAQKDSILTTDSVTVTLDRTTYRRNSEPVQVRNYGMAFGLTTPIVYDTQNKFYLSVGVHFEGVYRLYERRNSYAKLFTDKIKQTKTQYSIERQIDLPLESVSRQQGFVGMLGVSMPMMWHFSSFELKILPTVSVLTITREADKIQTSPQAANDRILFNSYSVQAVLTEIKETGINIGCEIRGLSGQTPAVFSVFLAKTFNIDKLGEFLRTK